MGFEAKRFYADFRKVAKDKGVSLSQASVETGVDSASLSRMGTIGAVPDGVNLAAMCKWSGLDASKYSVYLDDCER
jgi:hypothetical protein